MQKTRVILVDDHNAVRSGLRRLLEMGGDVDVVAEANNGEEACLLFTQFNPNVVVMDLSMPGISGFEALRRILATTPTAKVIMFSMHESSTFASQALANGARGYVAKSGLADDLLQAVREVASGKTYLSPSIAQKIALDSLSGEQDPVRKLSAREFEVFRLLAEGLSTDTIASLLNISQKTAANYQTILKQKLSINSPIELLRMAIAHGVIIE